MVSTTELMLGKRYRVIKSLSVGGMSQTYLAQDSQNLANSNCVVKKLKVTTNNPNDLEKTRQLFVKEAETLGKLGSHSRIPHLLTYFEEDQNFYLVQEFIEGHPLSREMSLGEWWPEAKVINLLEELLSILEFIHSQNVIHLDIKPANIIRRQHDQKLVLIDFGAVRQVQLQPVTCDNPNKTQSTILTCIGTKGYMPVEQAIGKPCFSSDLYALGMTAIQALTGILPLQLREDDEGEISWQSQAEVSHELADILTKMIRRYHKQRYQSATEVLQDLQAVKENIAPKNTTKSNTTNRDVTKEKNQSDFSEALHVNGDRLPGQKTFVKPMKTGSSGLNQSRESLTSNSPNSSQFSSANIPTVKSFADASTAASDAKVGSGKRKHGGAQFVRNHLLINGGLVILLGSLVTGAAYLGYREFQRRHQKALLDDIEVLRQQNQNETCIDKALEFPDQYPVLHRQSVDLLNVCAQRLVSEAKDLAENDSFLSAVSLTNKIPPEALAAYEEVKSLSKDWHLSVIQAAEGQYKQCKVDTAITWAGGIPEDSPDFDKAQNHIERWQQEWQANQSILANVEQSIANDEKVSVAQQNVDAENVRAAEQNVQAAEQTVESAQGQLRELTLLDQSILDSDDCRSLPEIKVVINAIEKRTEKISTLKKQIKDVKDILFLRRRNPLNVSAKLAHGEPRVSVLAEGGFLYRDYTIKGNAGDRWNISMTSSDFDTRLYLVQPDGEVRMSDDDGGKGYNSYIESVTLPETGSYRIRATAFHRPPSGQGQYHLLVTKFDD